MSGSGSSGLSVVSGSSGLSVRSALVSVTVSSSFVVSGSGFESGSGSGADVDVSSDFGFVPAGNETFRCGSGVGSSVVPGSSDWGSGSSGLSVVSGSGSSGLSVRSALVSVTVSSSFVVSGSGFESGSGSGADVDVSSDFGFVPAGNETFRCGSGVGSSVVPGSSDWGSGSSGLSVVSGSGSSGLSVRSALVSVTVSSSFVVSGSGFESGSGSGADVDVSSDFGFVPAGNETFRCGSGVGSSVVPGSSDWGSGSSGLSVVSGSGSSGLSVRSALVSVTVSSSFVVSGSGFVSVFDVGEGRPCLIHFFILSANIVASSFSKCVTPYISE